MSATLILVNGHSSSGKTTLANRLASELHIPCITKDHFKETLFERAPAADRDASRELGRLAYELAFTAVESVLASGSSAILEAPLHRQHSQAAIERIASATDAALLQIVLRADPAILERRYLDRQRSGERHPGHDVGFTIEELRATLAHPIEALEIDQTIEVDTSDFDALDRPFVLRWLNERLGTNSRRAL